MNFPWLSLIVFLPLFGALIILVIPGRLEKQIRLTAFVFSLLVFLLTLLLYTRFDSSNSLPQFVEHEPWLGFGISYHLGVDGLSLPLLLLTAFLTPVALLASWSSIHEKIKAFSFLFLVLETGLLGIFASLDLFLFYVFWEAMLIPMYFIIGVWGGVRRIYASLKFILMTMFGSLLMLAAILVLMAKYNQIVGNYSASIFDFYRFNLPLGLQMPLFLGFAVAFAIKVPVFPFHTWLPDAHVEAPTPGSVILAGVLLKTGVYGFIRLAIPFFPEAFKLFAPGLIILALIGVVYGGLMALVQKDIKSLVAYSSVSHLGLIMLAVCASNLIALEGSILMMVAHGLATGALFLAVGVIYERTKTRQMSELGGLGSKMPVFLAFFLISVLASLGLPGLIGFVGEFLCLFGLFLFSKTIGLISITTVVLSAAYLLVLIRKTMHGQLKLEPAKNIKDLDFREVTYFLPVVFLMIWLGLQPNSLLNKMEKSVLNYLQTSSRRTSVISDNRTVIKLPRVEKWLDFVKFKSELPKTESNKSRGDKR